MKNNDFNSLIIEPHAKCKLCCYYRCVYALVYRWHGWEGAVSKYTKLSIHKHAHNAWPVERKCNDHTDTRSSPHTT